MLVCLSCCTPNCFVRRLLRRRRRRSIRVLGTYFLSPFNFLFLLSLFLFSSHAFIFKTSAWLSALFIPPPFLVFRYPDVALGSFPIGAQKGLCVRFFDFSFLKSLEDFQNFFLKIFYRCRFNVLFKKWNNSRVLNNSRYITNAFPKHSYNITLVCILFSCCEIFFLS